MNRTFSCLMMSLPPTRWQQAVRLLQQDKILPGGPDQKYAAFLGDKFLGAAAAAAIHNSKDTYDEASASRLTGTVLSNKFMADRVESILPCTIYTDAAKLVSDHSVGTMVEAAVASVNDEEAVEDLVTWLIKEAGNLDMNAKGRLLELGGTVSSSSSSSSNPSSSSPPSPVVFRAIARLDDQVVAATGNSRKDAEQNAAHTCLQDMGHEIRIRREEQQRETHVMDPAAAAASLNQWHLFELDETYTRVVLKGDDEDETTLLEWWLRGAADPNGAFRRALLTPLVFPEFIISVDSWTRRSTSSGNGSGNGNIVEAEVEAAVITVITYYSSSSMDMDGTTTQQSCCCSSFVNVAASASKARAAVGIETNKLVSELLSIPLPVREEGRGE